MRTPHSTREGSDDLQIYATNRCLSARSTTIEVPFIDVKLDAAMAQSHPKASVNAAIKACIEAKAQLRVMGLTALVAPGQTTERQLDSAPRGSSRASDWEKNVVAIGNIQKL